ncbi:MAG: hypothetical protein ACOX6P_07030 [Candidatus Merdivicinus sp.]
MAKSDLRKLAESLGFFMDPAERFCYGRIRGFAVLLEELPRKCLCLKIAAKPVKGRAMPNLTDSSFLLPDAEGTILSCQISGTCWTVCLKKQQLSETEWQIKQILQRIWDILRTEGYSPCCMECGIEFVSVWQCGKGAEILCDDCAAKAGQILQETSSPARLGKRVFGLIVGSAVGFLLSAASVLLLMLGNMLGLGCAMEILNLMMQDEWVAAIWIFLIFSIPLVMFLWALHVLCGWILMQLTAKGISWKRNFLTKRDQIACALVSVLLLVVGLCLWYSMIFGEPPHTLAQMWENIVGFFVEQLWQEGHWDILGFFLIEILIGYQGIWLAWKQILDRQKRNFLFRRLL